MEMYLEEVGEKEVEMVTFILGQNVTITQGQKLTWSKEERSLFEHEYFHHDYHY